MTEIKCFLIECNCRGDFTRDGVKVEPTPGAMWFADWYQRKGPDGHHLIVRTPGGDWHVDGFASNCTRKGDWDHYCWVRHGEPPNITVDKNGNTCGCGCSIGQGEGYRDYHGFLRNGELVSA